MATYREVKTALGNNKEVRLLDENYKIGYQLILSVDSNDTVNTEFNNCDFVSVQDRIVIVN